MSELHELRASLEALAKELAATPIPPRTNGFKKGRIVGLRDAASHIWRLLWASESPGGTTSPLHLGACTSFGDTQPTSNPDWMREEYERAKARNEATPLHAQMTTTNPSWHPRVQEGES